MPECDKPTESVHHIFGRPPGEHSDSWFVLLPVSGKSGYGTPVGAMHPKQMAKIATPHAIGLCGNGTMGHHGDVEAHRAWIKYEEGEFVWYERERMLDSPAADGPVTDTWISLGPLDPQPARAVKARKPKKRKSGAARANRDRITIGVPSGFAKGGEVWDDLFGDGKDGRALGRVRERLGRLREEPEGIDTRPPFELIVDACNDWLMS